MFKKIKSCTEMKFQLKKRRKIRDIIWILFLDCNKIRFKKGKMPFKLHNKLMNAIFSDSQKIEVNGF